MQLGQTKVFLRAGQMAELDAKRAEMLSNAAKKIQRQVRTFLARRHLIAMRKAAVTIQKYWRGMNLVFNTMITLTGILWMLNILVLWAHFEFLGFTLNRKACTQAVSEDASRGCSNLHPEECPYVACQEEVYWDKGSCHQNPVWIPRYGCTKGAPLQTSDKGCHHYAGEWAAFIEKIYPCFSIIWEYAIFRFQFQDVLPSTKKSEINVCCCCLRYLVQEWFVSRAEQFVLEEDLFL